MIILIQPSVVEQFVAGRCQCLGYSIFIHIAEVCFQFVIQQFLIYNIFRKLLVPECQGDKQSGVANIHLVR